MGKFKTHEQFLKEVHDLVGDEYTVIGTYKKANEKILIMHNNKKCNNYEWKVKPSEFLHGVRCPMCMNRTTKSTEYFKNEVFELVGDEYIVLGEYKNSNEPILMKHSISDCGHEWLVQPSNFLGQRKGDKVRMGTRCPICSKNIKYTVEDFYKEYNKKLSKKYIINTDVKINNLVDKIEIQHKECGNTWNESAKNFWLNPKCPFCDSKKNYDGDFFKERVYELVKNEYTVLGEYIGYDKKLLMRHNSCGYEWEVTPKNFGKTNGTRCPHCRSSKGEQFIEKILMINKIPYKKQYKIKDCKREGILPFDFAVFEDKEKTKLKYLIEFDGKQHFQPVKFGNASVEEVIINFERQVKNDEIKNTYCEKHNITLIRISYKQFLDIPNILGDLFGIKIEQNYKIVV